MTYFKKELDLINTPEFKLGEYLYMGMAEIKGRTVCISVGYKIDYCVKKGLQFCNLLTENIDFNRINKVKVGELKKYKSFIINKKIKDECRKQL
jgi:hypothetical protein